MTSLESNKSLRQIIKAFMTVATLIALPGRFRVITAARDDLGGLTRGALDTLWPAQLADGLITRHLIDQMPDIDLHHGTPVRDGEMGCGKCTPSSHLRPWNPTCAHSHPVIRSPAMQEPPLPLT